MTRKGRMWTEYPTMFFEAMDYFRDNPEAVEWKRQCSKGEAYSLKTQFYRFFDKVREEYREATPEIRENTGLDSAYHWANNLIISAARFGEWWFIRLRKTVASDPERKLPPAIKERLNEISREITSHNRQQQASEQEDGIAKIFGKDWKGDIEPTTTEEQLRAEAAAGGSTVCPVTELPCRRKCESICIKNGEAIQKAAAPPSLGL